MITVFAASAVFSLLSLISYKSKLDSVRKFAFGVLLFSVVASPFINGLTSLAQGGTENILPSPDILDGNPEEIYEEAFSTGLKNAVCEKFSLKPGEVKVIVQGFSKEGWCAEKIKVVLSGIAALADYHEIERYINNMEIGECETEIEIG